MKNLIIDRIVRVTPSFEHDEWFGDLAPHTIHNDQVVTILNSTLKFLINNEFSKEETRYRLKRISGNVSDTFLDKVFSEIYGEVHYADV